MKTQQIKQLIQNDAVGKANPATEERLQKAFLARSASYRVHQNSFAGFFIWLFTTNQLATKLAIACLLAGFLAIRPVYNLNPSFPITVDSIRVDQSRVLDSALLVLPSDTTEERRF